MRYKLELEEAFEVDRNIEDCFNYIVDFSTIEEWDHTVIKSSKTSEGALGKGTTFDVTLQFGLSKALMKYEIVEFDFPNRAVLKGKSENFTAVDVVTLIQKGKKCEVNWQAEITFNKYTSFLKPFENKIRSNGVETIKGLKKALENQFAIPDGRYQLADRLVLPGLSLFTKRGYKKARKHFNPVSSSMRGKHIVITGATSGIGLATAESLAHKGANLTIVARNIAKAEKVANEIISKTGNTNIKIVCADMSLTQDVKRLVQELTTKYSKIDVLINNAGALFNPRQETKEGIEVSFALLLLNPFILTELLIPHLNSKARVVNVSSGGMYTQALTLENIESKKGKYSGSIAYAKAKRGLVACTEYWAKKYTNFVFHSMHPGWVDTPGVVNALPTFHKITKSVLRTPAQGADTIVWLACAKEAGSASGKFWLDRTPHTTDFFSKTRVSDKQKITLRKLLIEYAAKQAIKIDF